jgi:hypothetical protein
VSDVDYHQAHEPYIEVVAAAVIAAGVELADWGAEANDPRDGYLEPAPPIGPGPEDEPGGLWIGWSEERGWFYGETKGDGHGELSYLSYFGGSVLPDPETVAGLIALLVHGHDGLPNDAPTTGRWQYRSFEDSGDGFEAELASFHSRGGLGKTTTTVNLGDLR